MKRLVLWPFRSCILALGCWFSVRLPRTCYPCSFDTFGARCFSESSECALLTAPSCLSGRPVPGFTVCSHTLIHMIQSVTLSESTGFFFVLTLSFFFLIEEYNTSIQEKLPLIIGSAAAGLVFLIAVVVIVIVCNR